MTHAHKLLVCVVLSIATTAAARLSAAEPSNANFKLTIGENEVVVFIGGTNMVRMQQAGYLEAILAKAFVQQRPRFRDLSWEADTVFAQGTAVERWRRDGFGNRDKQYKFVGATVVLAQFGRLESMAGKAGLSRFVNSYNQLINGIQKQAKQLVLITPTRFEKPRSSFLPDVSRHNASLSLYVRAIRQIAAKRKLGFVDLFHDAPGRFTENGLHVHQKAQRDLAFWTARRMRVAIPPRAEIDRLRVAVKEKVRLWYDYWRPANWKLLYGDDSRRKFTKAGKDYPPFRVEWMRLKGMITKADERVWLIAAGGKDPGHKRPKPEILHAAPEADIKKELASFKVLDGLKVNLFASEKEGLTSPLAMRWDGAGRMYVTVSTTYPHVFPGDVPNDKIVLLEDTNRDGKADKSTVFASGLNIPTGIELGNGGVYVGQATELLFLKDTDGDGKADQRKVLLSGFGNGDSHQTINSFVWSPDGELYFGQGDGCESRVETPWGSSNLYQAGFYRLRPKRLKLDPLLDDFMGPGNPWGVAFDDWGQIFSIDGAGGVTFLSPGQIPVHHRKRLRRIGNPGGYCGIGYLDGSHLPKALRGDFAIGDFKPNRVKRFSVKSKGGGFELKWKGNLISSTHRNFRPIDVKVGPDGAVYVVDWYNPVTCHQDDSYRIPTRDKAHGRIWRIASSASPVTPPNLEKAPLTQVVGALKSTERWTRYQAKRVLTRHHPQAVAKELARFVKELDARQPGHVHHLFEALSAYATVEIVEPKLLSRLLRSTDFRARAFATRLVGRWQDRLVDPLALLEQRVLDSHPLVRMEAVVACAAIPNARSIEVAARVVDQSMDYWIDYVFTQAVHQLEPQWLPAFERGAREFSRPQQMAAVLSKSSGRRVLSGLNRLAQSTKLDQKSRTAAMAAVFAVGSPRDFEGWVLKKETYSSKGKYQPDFHAAALGRLIDNVRLKQMQPSAKITSQLIALIDSKHTGLRTNALVLSGLWRVKACSEKAAALASDDRSPTVVRAAAFDALARMRVDSTKRILAKYAREKTKDDIRASAIQSLARVDVTAAAIEAADLFAKANTKSAVFAATLQAFLDRKDGARILGGIVAKSKLKSQPAEALLAALYGAGRSDAELVKPLNQAIGLSGKAPKFSQKYLKSIVAEALAKGSPKRGAVIFRSAKLSCRKCHAVRGEGGVVGPNLTAIGSTLSAERIAEELLWPQRQVKEGYTLLQIVTDDGKLHQGYERKTRDSQKTGDVILRELTKNRFYTIPKDQIELRRVVGSAMPQGLSGGLTKSELNDLIRYLVGLRK